MGASALSPHDIGHQRTEGRREVSQSYNVRNYMLFGKAQPWRLMTRDRLQVRKRGWVRSLPAAPTKGLLQSRPACVIPKQKTRPEDRVFYLQL